MKTTTFPSNNSMNRSPLRLGLLLNALALAVAWLAPSQLANAQCPQICDSGNDNTAFGLAALPSDSGGGNTAVGFNVLFNNAGGGGDTAIGALAFYNNTTGNFNTATGDGALDGNTIGNSNTATGWGALSGNTTGNSNTATGHSALISNTTGAVNTANGANALISNTTGSDNTATGDAALFGNTTGFGNTANGSGALQSNTTGSNNIALGFQAGQKLTTGSNNIDIGNFGSAGDSKRIRIGTSGTQIKAFIAGISGATVPTGVAVIIDTDGHLGTMTSSARFKDAVEPMDKASEAILALKPVTFRYKNEFDPKGIPQFGLVAEDVEKVNPDLVARDEQGKPYTVRYDAVNAMLLNEFLKEHRSVQEQGAIIVQQQKQIEALTAGLQKVSAQLAVSKPAPQTVLNDQ